MSDGSNRIGSSRPSSGMELLRQLSGVGTAGSGTPAAPVAPVAAAGNNTSHGGFGPRGNRILPADFPLDQLDRRAARGTYLDILV